MRSFITTVSQNIIRETESGRMRGGGGHVAMRNAYESLVGTPVGKRPSGRPRRRWEDNI
jgi:hypothetical protein